MRSCVNKTLFKKKQVLGWIYWPLLYGVPLLKTLQLLPKAFRIKSDLFTLLYKAPYHPAPPFLGHKDPLVVAQSYALPLLPRSGQALLLSCEVLSSSCMAGLLLSLRSQIKCCFFIEPFSTMPQRMVHLAFLACPLQSTWLFLQSFDEFVPLMVCHPSLSPVWKVHEDRGHVYLVL